MVRKSHAFNVIDHKLIYSWCWLTISVLSGFFSKIFWCIFCVCLLVIKLIAKMKEKQISNS